MREMPVRIVIKKNKKKVAEWFNLHELFPQQKEIMAIFTGVIGNENINCCDAFKAVSYTHLDVYKRQLYVLQNI